ncbi:MAG TPA: hypothetical protein VKE98_05680, partial [Gemmataceae bacterium]|nr:hypothetical protein [Gemmataceae bacterium]
MNARTSWMVMFASMPICLVVGTMPVQADPPKLLEVRVQKVKGTTYFHLRLEAPKDMAQNAVPRGRLLPMDFGSVEPLSQPQLVPQDENTRAVYLRAVQPEDVGKGPLLGPIPKKVELGPNPEKADEKRIEEKQEEKKEPKPPAGDKEKVPEPPPEPPGPPIQRKKDRSAADVLEFVGKVTGKNEASFLLIYRRESKPAEKGQPESLQQLLQRTQSWV